MIYYKNIFSWSNPYEHTSGSYNYNFCVIWRIFLNCIWTSQYPVRIRIRISPQCLVRLKRRLNWNGGGGSFGWDRKYRGCESVMTYTYGDRLPVQSCKTHVLIFSIVITSNQRGVFFLMSFHICWDGASRCRFSFSLLVFASRSHLKDCPLY